jgi:hypothetical protein
MRFIEMTGETLLAVVTDHDLPPEELRAAGVTPDAIVRINEQGDIELRRTRPLGCCRWPTWKLSRTR